MNEDLSKAILAKLEELKKATAIASKDILSVEECAIFTGLTKLTIYSLSSKRDIPHYKKGNKLYFSKKELEAWIRKDRIATNDEISARAATYVGLHKAKYL
jgi:excisionase family DNA binding protein